MRIIDDNELYALYESIYGEGGIGATAVKTVHLGGATVIKGELPTTGSFILVAGALDDAKSVLLDMADFLPSPTLARELESCN